MSKQPFSYYGGKQRLASKIIPLIPKHTVYVEPFCGGASVFWRKPWPNVTNAHHYREVLNDKDLRIVNFLRVLRDKENGAELIRRLQLTPYARQEHKERNREPADDIDAAELFFVNIMQSFSNKVDGGWSTCVYERNHAATWLNKVNALPDFVGRLMSTYIENLDAIELIKKWDSPQTLFYVDPPYPEADQGHYSGYTQQDFEQLIDALQNAKGSFLLSCYANEAVPDDWERFEFSARCSAANGKHRGDKEKTARAECVWRVMRNHNVRPEIQKLFDSGKFDCFAGEQNEWS